MSNQYSITALKALQDNYIWVISNQESALVVDPSDANVVRDFLVTHNLNLVAILLTHNHQDHNGGVVELQQEYSDFKCYNYLDDHISDNITIDIANFPLIKVIATPGHMMDHVCYLVDNKHLFCGDTLFSLGCGRIFSGNFIAAYASLAKVKSLPETTWCYPAHEYTLANLKFTLSFDNDYEYYAQLKTQIDDKLALDGRSLPVRLADELKYNLFLRCNEPKIQQLVANKIHQNITDELECFIGLRELRNSF